jgi:hypothetical protein
MKHPPINPLFALLICLAALPFLFWAAIIAGVLAVHAPWVLAALVVTVVTMTVRGRRKRRARDLAARADYEHWLYLCNDVRGIYGRYLPPEEFQVML